MKKLPPLGKVAVGCGVCTVKRTKTRARWYKLVSRSQTLPELQSFRSNPITIKTWIQVEKLGNMLEPIVNYKSKRVAFVCSLLTVINGARVMLLVCNFSI